MPASRRNKTWAQLYGYLLRPVFSPYKSSAIQAETYLLACQRYIELNPVRAAMVENAGDYRWSSFRHNAMGQDDGLITPHDLYSGLGHDAPTRQAAYRTLFGAELNAETVEGLRLALKQNQPMGNDRFHQQIARITGVRREAKPRGRPRLESTGAEPSSTGQGELVL